MRLWLPATSLWPVPWSAGLSPGTPAGSESRVPGPFRLLSQTSPPAGFLATHVCSPDANTTRTFTHCVTERPVGPALPGVTAPSVHVCTLALPGVRTGTRAMAWTQGADRAASVKGRLAIRPTRQRWSRRVGGTVISTPPPGPCPQLGRSASCPCRPQLCARCLVAWRWACLHPGTPFARPLPRSPPHGCRHRQGHQRAGNKHHGLLTTCPKQVSQLEFGALKTRSKSES